MRTNKKTQIFTNNLLGYIKHKKANSYITLRSSWENKTLEYLEKCTV